MQCYALGRGCQVGGWDAVALGWFGLLGGGGRKTHAHDGGRGEVMMRPHRASSPTQMLHRQRHRGACVGGLVVVDEGVGWAWGWVGGWGWPEEGRRRQMPVSCSRCFCPGERATACNALGPWPPPQPRGRGGTYGA